MNSDSRETNDVALDLTGQQIGDYNVIRRLGRGGMADVYLAEQISLKRNVALKVLKPELAKDQSYVVRFHREAQSAASLVQANIVQIYEVGEFQGLHFISQEYVAGRNLRQHLARYGAVEPVMALSVLRQVAMALQKAGESNVIHRDIKPENIMLAASGEIKVADFGLARINSDETKKDLTQIGVTMGTPLYMSPEQVEGKAVDPRSDIYSLGITVYHILAGEPPFDGETALAIALKHVQNQPEPLHELRPDIPVALTELISRMISKDLADRPSSAAQLLKELRKIKIDSDQDWEQLVEKLASAETSHGVGSITDSNLAVTRQLQAVMKGNLQSWWSRPITIFVIVTLLASGGFLGYWLATNNGVNDPLELAISQTPEIPRLRDIREQYEYASNRDRVEVWESVLEYFPLTDDASESNTTAYYHNLTNQRLGELFIRQSDWDRALPIYKKFAEYRPADPFCVLGHAGLAIIYDAQGQADLVADELFIIRDAVENAMNGNLEILQGDFLNRVMRLYNDAGIDLDSSFTVPINSY